MDCIDGVVSWEIVLFLFVDVFGVVGASFPVVVVGCSAVLRTASLYEISPIVILDVEDFWVD